MGFVLWGLRAHWARLVDHPVGWPGFDVFRCRRVLAGRLKRYGLHVGGFHVGASSSVMNSVSST